MTLQEKIMDAFVGKVVRKDLAFLVKGSLPVPTYVLEYLLGQYCASDDAEAIENGVTKVKEVIQNNYVHRADAERIKGVIKENGRHRIIDKVAVTLNERDDQYQATFANLGLVGVPIGAEYVKQNPKLLSGNGVWCIVTVGYISGESIKVRWEIQTLKPIQISNINIEEYIEHRKEFTTDEWIDFMVHTVGLNPELLSRREKFIALARLLPHVENNFNFMELGPKGTGKSHVFQELSPYGVLVSGGDVTSPRLFVKIVGQKEYLGLVGYWDVVTWDEFEQQKGRNVDAVMIDTMQNYLANKSFNRGKATHEASASMCFVGNTKHSIPYILKNSHLFESIPTQFIKGAFLDRIHLYNPGWEVKILKKKSFSTGYGLITDYIAAVLHDLRNIDLTGRLAEYAKFDGSLSERDHNAIRKTFSGMMKLLYPDGNMTEDEAFEIINFAAECRKRVKDQLYIIDETFKVEPALFKYTNVLTGDEVVVETLENLSNNHSCPVTAPFFEETETTTEDALPDVTSAPYSPNDEEKTSIRPAASPKRLHEKRATIRGGQKGVSYKKLFGPYLQTAKHIVVTDPFIRASFQIDNLIELIQVCRECSEHGDDLTIVLNTQIESSKYLDMVTIFDGLKAELASIGINFEYTFDADHDRSIQLDNGWVIDLSRGLDIFERFDRFSLGCTRQEDRSCRENVVTITKNDNNEEKDPKDKDSLYLPIQQEYFDKIISGEKKIEYREIKDSTRNRYIQHEKGEFVKNPNAKEGEFPYLPILYKYLNLAVGYNTNRDTSKVEVTGQTFYFDAELGNWVMEIHLGEIIEVHRKK